jgi:anti-sigma regulatory factor (Ser/Thr protein kinase)
LRSVTRSFPAAAPALADIRGFLRELAARAGVGREATNDLLVAAIEACTNAIEHSGSDSVEVSWTDAEDAVTIDVRDAGVFRSRVRIPEVEGPGGYGIPLMAALTDELEIREGTAGDPGTHVRLRRRLEPS